MFFVRGLKKLSSSESAEIIREFLEETREFVENLNPLVQRLEQSLERGNLDIDETINAVFRGFHSIKGSANFLKLDLLAKLTHEVESLLDSLRKHKLALHTSHVAALFNCECLMEKLLDQVERGHHPDDLETETRTTVARFRQLSSETQCALVVAIQLELDLAKQSRSLLEELRRHVAPNGDTTHVPEFGPIIETLDYLGYQDWVVAFRKLNFLVKNFSRQGTPLPRPAVQLALSLLETLLDHAGPNRALASIAERQKELDELLLQEQAESQSESGPPMLGETLVDLGIIQEDQLAKALKLQGSPLGTILREMELVHQGELDMALRIQQKQTAKDEVLPYKSSSIRVNTERLNNLCNLVEELVLAETLLAHDWHQATGQVDNQSSSGRLLNRISRDLQQIARQLRMVPLDAAFQKLGRLARDLASKLEKRIKVEIHGGDTEIDKNVVELLGNPLAHMVRNALDHGLETPAERRAAGKSEFGTLTLSACHEGANIVVRIKDDGRGLSTSKILAKARERGLIGSIPPSTPAEIFELIWLPGFSTAATVTELSGRGVGMDVVRREVEALRGQVAIASQLGMGSCFTLTIPLSLSIIDGMLVQAGDHVFTLPLLDTRQTLGSADLTVVFPPGMQPRVRIQDRLLPVFSLHDFFSSTNAYRRDPVYVVVEAGQHACCLSVDEVVGMRRTVIQAVPNYLGKPRAIAGFSILGDGTITYILDTLQIWKLCQAEDQQTATSATNSSPKTQNSGKSP